MSAVRWRLLHPFQWRTVRRYQRTFGRRALTAEQVNQLLLRGPLDGEPQPQEPGK